MGEPRVRVRLANAADESLGRRDKLTDQVVANPDHPNAPVIRSR